jgi:hypothetical protein
VDGRWLELVQNRAQYQALLVVLKLEFCVL